MNEPPRIERIAAVLKRTGLSRSKLYELKSRGDFPAAVKLSERTVGFLSYEIDEWIIGRACSRAGDIVEGLAAASSSDATSRGPR